jgi:hypothetical protein
MSPRAINLAEALCGQLAEFGPGVCSLSVSELASWYQVRVGVRGGAASNDNLFRLADDLGLDPARTGAGVWCRQMVLRPSGAIVMSARVHRGEVKP